MSFIFRTNESGCKTLCLIFGQQSLFKAEEFAISRFYVHGGSKLFDCKSLKTFFDFRQVE